jgi:hypothetical protein
MKIIVWPTFVNVPNVGTVEADNPFLRRIVLDDLRGRSSTRTLRDAFPIKECQLPFVDDKPEGS